MATNDPQSQQSPAGAIAAWTETQAANTSLIELATGTNAPAGGAGTAEKQQEAAPRPQPGEPGWLKAPPPLPEPAWLKQGPTPQPAFLTRGPLAEPEKPVSDPAQLAQAEQAPAM
jgi:hypothetical protein